MPSIIEGYNYDIFISYRQKDNKHDGWVTEFVNNLKGELESTFKEEISVYFDINPHDGLLETHDVDESLKEKLKCLVFIPIISRTYCDPKSFAWEHEFKAFVELASKDKFGLKVKLPNGNVASRVLPIRIYDLDNSDIKLCESVLGSVLRGIEFIYAEPGVNRPLRSNEENPHTNLNHTIYRNQINKLANSIKDIINAIGQYIPRLEEGQKEPSKSSSEARKSNKPLIIIGAIIALALIVLGLLLIPKLLKHKEQLEKSIAVLLFRNDTPVDSNKFFIDGIMEEVLLNLQAIKDLRVLSRTSVEQYRNTARLIPEIAKELGVNYIVEGSGQKSGNNFRLRVQLIKAKGKEDHIWAKSFERKIQNTNDIFRIQSEIAKEIATELNATMTPEEKLFIEKTPTTNLDALYFYQRGNEELSKYTPHSSNKLNTLLQNINWQALANARKMFNKALDNDSTFAAAYIGLSKVCLLSYGILWDSVLILANKALYYDNQAFEAHIMKGNYYWYNGNMDLANNEYDKALKINPNSWIVYYQKGQTDKNDNLLRSIQNLTKATSLNRGQELIDILYEISTLYKDVGLYDKCIDIAFEVLKLDGDSIRYFSQLSSVNLFRGNNKIAIDFLERAYSIDSTNITILCQLGNIYLFLHQWQESLKYFKKYYESKAGSTIWLAQMGYVYWKNGYKKEADIFFNRKLLGAEYSIKNKTRSAQLFYPYFDLAAVYAFRGDKEKVYEYLKQFSKKQILHDYDVWHINYDPWYDFIRDEPEFKNIASEMEAKYQAEHDRVRKWLEENNML